MLFHVDIKTQGDARTDRLLREQHDTGLFGDKTNMTKGLISLD